MTTTQTTSPLHNSGLTIENAPLFYRAVWAYMDLVDALANHAGLTGPHGSYIMSRRSGDALEHYAAIAQLDVSVALAQVIDAAKPLQEV